MAETTKGLRARDAGFWLTLLLGALVLLNYVDRGAIGIAAPRLKDELMLSAAAFGLAVSAFSWIYAPAQFARRLALGSILRLSADRRRTCGVGARHLHDRLRKWSR